MITKWDQDVTTLGSGGVTHFLSAGSWKGSQVHKIYSLRSTFIPSNNKHCSSGIDSDGGENCCFKWRNWQNVCGKSFMSDLLSSE